MNESIHQLTFVATRRSDAEILSPAEQLQRLTASRRGFEGMRLTGLLLYNGNRLLYHLEGAEAAVMAQHDKIKGDPRVEGVATLRQRTSDGRLFSGWNFALAGDPRETGATSLADRVAEMVAGIPAEITQTFLAFAKLPVRARAA